MALTITTQSRDVLGQVALKVVKLTFDNSYPTGGYPLTPNMVGMQTIIGFIPEPAAVDGSGTTACVVDYDFGTQKVQCYGGATAGAVLSELTAATNLTNFVSTVIILGRGLGN